MWITYAFLSAVFAALVAVFAKLGLKTIDPVLSTTIRSMIMAVFLIISSLILKKFNDFSLSTFGARDWIFIILAGVAGALSWIFYFIAIKYGVAGKVVAIDRLSIVLVIFLAAIFLGEDLGWKTILGAATMVVGAYLITLK